MIDANQLIVEMQDTVAERIVRELEEGCEADVERLRVLASAMEEEMKFGLVSHEGSKLKMLLTFVENLPNGTEKGIYYALDVGGTNFRIMRVKLSGERSSVVVEDMERQPIPREKMKGTSEEFFDYLASAIQGFLEKEDIGDQRRQLGFTFSFPVKQTSISTGSLIKWTKGFAIKDAVGKEVSWCLQRALDKKKVNMQVTALVNDTVGTLALGTYHDSDTIAAVIIGTGTNACYYEQGDAIKKSERSKGMVINMEWGNFGSSHLPTTPYDIEMDADTPNPGDMAFEKMISGMYLGDIVRRVILRLSKESKILGNPSNKLSEAFALGTPSVTAMHEDSSAELEQVARIMTDVLEVADIPLEGRKHIVKICDIITRRAGRLSAAGIAAILKKLKRDRNDTRSAIAVEGGLYASYGKFRDYLHEALVEILGKDVERHVALNVTEDGSGVGAALIAASHPP